MNHSRLPTEIKLSHQTAHPEPRAALHKAKHPSGKSHPFRVLLTDLQVIYQRDPAAHNWLEVLFCYPGLQALWWYRVAHWLHTIGVPFLPRFLSQLSRWLTGIEIHPAAQIGQGVFIDHGMGVVIGETAIVGDYTLIYQGVTLGGTGKDRGKRHPTLGDHVIVGAGAKVLGNIQLGDHVRVGAGSVVLRDVPSHCTVVGIPGRITRRYGLQTTDLADNELRDVEAEVIRALFERVKTLEQQLEQLQTQLPFLRVPDQPSPPPDVIATADEVIKEFLDGAGI